jgi:Domain of unknown function (DUF4148)
MNVKQLIAATAVFAAAGSVYAQQREYIPPAEGFVSTKSRAEVIAELNQAKASGTYVNAGSEEFPGQFAALAGKSGAQTRLAGKSRAEVVAELRQAEDSGNFVMGGREYEGQHIVSTWPRREAQPFRLARRK